MAKMELKEIPIEKVYPNWFQPRKSFDKEKIKELSESILSNGLINPITIKKWRDNKYQIVSGERRWRAHKLANIKTIQAIVKEYKDDGQFMVDSLIENIQRTDLSPTEKGKFCLKIKKQMHLKNNEQVARVIKIRSDDVSDWIDNYEINKSPPGGKKVSAKLSRSTRTFPDNERKDIIKFAEKEGKSGSFIEEEFVPTYKKSDEPTKKALLSEDINVEQAERISKLKTEKERAIAIDQHKKIAEVQKGVERAVEQQMSAVEKRRLDKNLVQAKNWIASLKGKVVDSKKEIEKTLKVLMVCTKFISVMDEPQKEKLDETLDRFIEVLDKGKQIAEQIQGKL